MPKTKTVASKKNKNRRVTVSSGIAHHLSATPSWIKPIQCLFIVKAIFMIILATLLVWRSSFLISVIPYLIIIFFIINGLIMIGVGTMANSRPQLITQTISSLVFGGLSIISASLPLILPHLFTNLIPLLIILCLIFDLLFTIISLFSFSISADRQWWQIGSGLIGVFVIANIIWGSNNFFNFWLLFYLAAEGIIYFCSPFFLAKHNK